MAENSVFHFSAHSGGDVQDGSGGVDGSHPARLPPFGAE